MFGSLPAARSTSFDQQHEFGFSIASVDDEDNLIFAYTLTPLDFRIATDIDLISLTPEGGFVWKRFAGGPDYFDNDDYAWISYIPAPGLVTVAHQEYPGDYPPGEPFDPDTDRLVPSPPTKAASNTLSS